jgi:hypothetical protein
MQPDSSPILAPPASHSVPWYRKKWAQYAGLAAGTILILYGMIYMDVVSRAKEAYMEGEKYWRWHEHPEEKKAEIAANYEKAKVELDVKLAKNKIAQGDYDRQLEILQFDREHQMEESSIKYAYVWYQTAYELFSPPESKWVKLSREKAPLAKEKWKEELRAKKIPFEEYMLE